MGEESEITEPVPVVENVARPAPPPAPVPVNHRATLALLIALAGLVLGTIALWRAITVERGQGEAQAALRSEVSARIEELARGGEQRKHDVDALRTRIADADGINKSVREELLALGERSRHLEDAVANLAEQRLTGREALALNEAEFLHSALASAEDPVFAGVRQTIGAEMQALQASKPLETHATLAALERIRTDLAKLPGKPERSAADAQPASRLAALLQQFVRVSTDKGELPGSRNPELTRSLASIDLHAAEAALLARDPAAYASALTRTRAALAGSFDEADPAVKGALAELDRLASAPLAPAMPELGSALRELRNLRATRALSQPRAAAHASDGAGT